MEIENKIIYNIQETEHVDKLIEQSVIARKTNISLALQLSLQAVKLSCEQQYTEGLAKSNLEAGICSRLLSNYGDAFIHYNEALKIYRKLGDKKGESRTYNTIGNTHMMLSEFPKAIEFFDESIYTLQSIGDIEFEAIVLSNKGLAYQQFGNLKLSLGSFLQSMSIYRTINKDIPHFLFNNLGIIYMEMGNYCVSLKYFIHALKIEVASGMLLDQASTLANIGRSYIYLNDFLNAVSYLSEALIVFKKLGDRQSESQVYSNLGKAYASLRYFPEALNYFNKSLKYYKEIKDQFSVAHTLCELGELYFALNDYSGSRKLHLESLQLAHEIKDELNITRNYIGFIKLYLKFFDFDLIKEYSSKAIKLAEKRKAYKELKRIYEILSIGYKTIGNKEESNNYYQKLVECTEVLNNLEEENLRTFTYYNKLNFDETELKDKSLFNGPKNEFYYKGNGVK